MKVRIESVEVLNSTSWLKESMGPAVLGLVALGLLCGIECSWTSEGVAALLSSFGLQIAKNQVEFITVSIEIVLLAVVFASFGCIWSLYRITSEESGEKMEQLDAALKVNEELMHKARTVLSKFETFSRDRLDGLRHKVAPKLAVAYAIVRAIEERMAQVNELLQDSPSNVVEAVELLNEGLTVKADWVSSNYESANVRTLYQNLSLDRCAEEIMAIFSFVRSETEEVVSLSYAA